MAVSMKQVMAALSSEETDYAEAAKLGVGAIPHLRELVAGDDTMMASKAAYLAGLIDAEGSGEILAQAAQSDQAVVRVAAANSLANLSNADATLFEGLLSDPDVGVRKATVRSVGSAGRADLKPLIEQLASGDTADSIRELAATTAKNLR
jgi:HEAT repeat protein